MTVLMSGINMFSMAVVMKVIVGWAIHFSILVSTATVAVYVALGGLLPAIVNEVVQFVLIWAGTIAIPVLGLMETGGWKGMLARIAERAPGATPWSRRRGGRRGVPHEVFVHDDS